MRVPVLEYVQRGLIAALSVVLAFAVFFMFRTVLRSPAGETTEISTEAAAGPDVSLAPTEPSEPDSGAAPTTTVPASVVPQAFTPLWSAGPCDEASPTASDEVTVLRVYFNCGEATSPTATTFVYRDVPATSRVLTNTFRQLVRGPGPNELSRGFGSFFSAGDVTIESVTLREGRAIIDFSGLDGISGQFTNQTAVEFFLANLGANAFQFSSVQAIEYRADGNCTDFWEMLGASSCEVISRAQWLASVDR